MGHDELMKRESAKDRTSEVEIAYPPSGMRYWSHTTVTGAIDAALDHAAWIVQRGRANATPCYEHMAPRIDNVAISDGNAIVLISQNNYAGD